MPTTSESSYDVIMIGAGHNGLTCAALLAKQGRRVLLLERRDVAGGLAVGDVFHADVRAVGLHHDTCFLRPGVVDGLNLTRFGLDRSDQPEPVFVPQDDGPGLLLHADPVRAADEISVHSKRDAERYVAYRAFLSRIAGCLRRLLDEPPPDLIATGNGASWQLLTDAFALRRLGRRDMTELLRIGPMCVGDWLGEWFDSEPLVCALAAPALDGMMAGPRSPGTTAGLLRWQCAAGSDVRGGPAALIGALEQAARHHGVEIRLETEVTNIRVESGRARGVTLVNGERIDANVVVSACDPKTTLLCLAGDGALTPTAAKHVGEIRMRGTTAKVNLLLSDPLRFACRPNLDVRRARIGVSLDELERAYDAVKYRRFSERPVLDVLAPPPDEASASARHVVSVIAHFAPYDLDGGWSDAARERLGDTIVEALARYAPNVPGAVIARDVLTPVDIERRFGVAGGHIHHGEHALDQLLVRPCLECTGYATPIAGLFLCGSGCHPGGGLTGAPGALAARMIEKHHAATRT